MIWHQKKCDRKGVNISSYNRYTSIVPYSWQENNISKEAIKCHIRLCVWDIMYRLINLFRFHRITRTLHQSRSTTTFRFRAWYKICFFPNFRSQNKRVKKQEIDIELTNKSDFFVRPRQKNRKNNRDNESPNSISPSDVLQGNNRQNEINCINVCAS